MLQDFSKRREKALTRCHRLIDLYDKRRSSNRFYYQMSQTVTVVFSALTPVLILWTELPKSLQALPAALVAISSALALIFKFRDNYFLFTITWEALNSERTKYETRTTEKYSGHSTDEEEALNNFVINMENIITSERLKWITENIKETAQVQTNKSV